MARPARRTRDDLKNLILDAAAEVLDRDGFGVMSSTLTYKQVFDHLEAEHGIRVTRGSVHERIWASQQEFQLDVLSRAATWNSDVSTARTTEVLTGVFLRASDEGWTAVETILEMSRVGGEVNFESADEDDLYFGWMGLTLAIAQAVDPNSEEYRALARSVTASYADLTTDFLELYKVVFAELGFRVRQDRFADPEAALVALTKLATAMSEGVSLRRRFDDNELPSLALTVGRSIPQDWHPFSVGFAALLEFFLEPDPSHPSAVAGPDWFA